MNEPPPFNKPKKRRLAPVLIIVGVVIITLIITGITLGIRFISEHGLTEPMDRKFGDQNLKSTLAMVELHNIRYGQYPDSLRDIKYTGDWDQIWIQGTSYYPSDDRKSYYIEVHRGWVGKPTLVMPEEFWRNTGYDERLKPTE